MGQDRSAGTDTARTTTRPENPGGSALPCCDSWASDPRISSRKIEYTTIKGAGVDVRERRRWRQTLRHVPGLKSISGAADGIGMVETAAESEPAAALTRSNPQERWTEELLAGIDVDSALRVAGLFFSLWMIGVWTEDLHTPITGLHTVAGLLAFSGCLLFLMSSYAAIRAWQLRPRW